MPSTTSSSFSRPEPSSTVMTPSLPTLSIASAMILPMASSELAEMVPTWAIALLSVQGLDIFLSSATAADTALSIPRFKSIGFMPAASDFLHHLRAHVLELVLEFDLFRDGHAVLRDRGGAETLFEHHVAAFRAERDLDGVRQDVHTLHHAGAGVVAELNFFCCHIDSS